MQFFCYKKKKNCISAFEEKTEIALQLHLEQLAEEEKTEAGELFMNP